MKNWSAIDTLNSERIYDVFSVKRNEKGNYVLKIGVVSNYCFYKKQNNNDCIVLTCVFSENFEKMDFSFSIEKVFLSVKYTFEEFDGILENLSFINSKKEFLDAILKRGGNITSRQMSFSSEDFISSLMAIFSYYANKKYKVNVKSYGRVTSPKNRNFRLALSRAIIASKKPVLHNKKRPPKRFKKAAGYFLYKLTIRWAYFLILG